MSHQNARTKKHRKEWAAPKPEKTLLTPEQIIVNDEKAAPVKVPITPRGAAVASGFAYNKLAGKPTKQAVIQVFGQNGYSAYSWASRAAKLGITPEELCAQFVKDPHSVKEAWTKATTKPIV